MKFSGVTTVVDAGSAGCMTFRGLRKYICEKSATRVLALLNIACHGLAGAGCAGEEFGPGGENDHLNALKLRQCIECIEANRDLIVGIKARNQPHAHGARPIQDAFYKIL